VLSLTIRVRRAQIRPSQALNELEMENARLCRAVSDLTLEKLILKEAASRNWQASPAVAPVWIT
jgi:hypothetical protein